MTMPSIAPMSDEERAALQAEFGVLIQEAKTTESQPPRRRGRPPGTKNKPKDPLDEVIVTRQQQSLLEPAPLTKRDEKEVASRLQGILTGATGVLSVAKEPFQMTDEEAEAISAPLASYLIRNEPTSGVARQILEEYDIAAFSIASMAYGVRVYRDLKKEREQNAPAKPKLINLNPPTEDVPNNGTETESGQERPVNRQLASAPIIGGSFSEV